MGADGWAGHRDWMRRELVFAAEHFSVSVIGEPVFGWRERTIGSRTRNERWLRVSWSETVWTDGEWWTGNEDAAAIASIPKPVVLDVYDWTESHLGADDCRLRAELMTLVGDPPCSATEELRSELDVPDEWWSELRTALDRLADTPTNRGETTQQDVTNRLLAYFGGGVDPQVSAWRTAHNDLNWSNVTAPNLALLDWESWGRKMAGYDAASLYVLALRVPDTAKKLHETFADVLDGPDGRRAQLFAITRYLRRVEIGDFHDLADTWHAHTRALLDG